MLPTTSPRLRFLQTVRRARLARVAATGALGALVMLPVACASGDDAAVFSASDAIGTTASDDTPVDDTAGVDTVAAPVDDAADASPDVTSDAASEEASGATIPATSEMVVDFTYAASGGGRVRNPYVAVWVEDADGNLVQTISVWFEPGKGERWLNELSSWYGATTGATGGSALTSGATRAAGSYAVVWDGTRLDGELVEAGSYVLYVESAREHGPHSLTSAPITVGDDGFTVSLTDDGELSALSATMTV